MASSSLRYRNTRVATGAPITPLHLLLLASLSLGAVAWGGFLIFGQHGGDTVKYLLLLGLYGVASAAFVLSRIRENHLRFFDIPVFLTILIFIEFGLAPLECFANPSQLNYKFDGNYAFLLRALVYVMAGMSTFWAGCAIAERRTKPKATQEGRDSEQQRSRANARIFQATVGIYAVAFAVKLYLLTHHLYSFLGSGSLYFQHLASMQALMVAAGFGTYALVIACIERYLCPSDHKWRVLFLALFASECFWGLISGMKELLIQNFVIVALVSSLVQRRFRKWLVIAIVFAVIVVYPVTNAYRTVVKEKGDQVTSLATAVTAGAAALTKTRGLDSGIGVELENGWRSTVSRVDLLQSPGLIMLLGANASRILGNERWWMLPFYSFVPRYVWHSKPALLEGARFSVALGYGSPGSTAWTVGTSTAVTYPGDLYIRGGLPAVVAGMFLLGIATQWLTGKATGAMDRHRLFIYASIFLTATDVEIDAFSFWSTLIKAFAILTITAWVVYGPRRQARSKGKRYAA